jgi:hypothetical protein
MRKYWLLTLSAKEFESVMSKKACYPFIKETKPTKKPAMIIDNELNKIALDTHSRLKNPVELKQEKMNPYKAVEVIASSILQALVSTPMLEIKMFNCYQQAYWTYP